MSFLKRFPHRLLVAAALLAAVLCLLPARVGAPDTPTAPEAPSAPAVPDASPSPDASAAPNALTALNPSDAPKQAASALPAGTSVPAGADLSERTASGCALHLTLYYDPCGHSVQRREPLSAKLVGLSRQALEAEIGEELPGAAVTGFSASEVDAALNLPIPCPLHWVLAAGEDGHLVVMQNRNGEALEAVRSTDVPLSRLSEEQRQALPQLFDDVQALEGVLESLAS